MTVQIFPKSGTMAFPYLIAVSVPARGFGNAEDHSQKINEWLLEHGEGGFVMKNTTADTVYLLMERHDDAVLLAMVF